MRLIAAECLLGPRIQTRARIMCGTRLLGGAGRIGKAFGDRRRQNPKAKRANLILTTHFWLCCSVLGQICVEMKDEVAMAGSNRRTERLTNNPARKDGGDKIEEGR
jgi:hypothetical protein